jgi:hypothetical protein
MHLFIPSLFALAGSAAAVGNAVVLNNSTSPLYVWSVSSTVGPEQKVVPGMSKQLDSLLDFVYLALLL